MKSVAIKLFFTVAIYGLLVSVARGQEFELREDLTFYHRFTQIGTVAKRTFTSTDGLVRKVIYYSLKNLSVSPPYTESILVEQSIVVNSYDDQRRPVREEHYDGRIRPKFVWQIAYWFDGTRRTLYTPDRRRQYEIRYVDGRSGSHLYYDRSGKNLKAIRGGVPEDEPLPFGWGEPTGGLSCGIVVTQADSGDDQLSGNVVYVNIRNVGSAPASIKGPPAVEFELRDARGRIITPRADDPDGKRARVELHRYFNDGTIAPGNSAYPYPAYPIDHYYADLEPGRYSIRARFATGTDGRFVISNTASFEVGGKKD